MRVLGMDRIGQSDDTSEGSATGTLRSEGETCRHLKPPRFKTFYVRELSSNNTLSRLR